MNKNLQSNVKKKILYIILTLTIAIVIFNPSLTADLFKKSDHDLFPKKEFALETQDGEIITMQLEMADTLEKRNIGLMNRKDLGEDITGMIFIFQKEGKSGFWMKDTYIPLSVAFLNEKGIIQEMIQMDLCPENIGCPVYYPKEEYKYAIEVKQGFFEDKKISVGDKVLGLQ